MKSTIYKFFTLALVSAIVIACGSAPVGDKQAQLDSLRQQQTAIKEQIELLEQQIALENPTETVVRAKDVGVMDIAARKFDYYVQTQGRVEAENNIMLSAKGMGVVTQVYVKEGQTVAKGQTLAQIDNSVLVKNIESMKSQLELVTTVYERQKNLWEQKIGTEVQYLQAKTNKESLEKQIAGLNEQNEMTKIKASVAGTIDEILVKVGENIAPGMPAARIVNTSELKLTAAVSEAHVTAIKTGNKVIVSIPELKKDIEARVTFVGKNIDMLSRTFPVEVSLPYHEDLRPNMSAVIKVIFQTEANAITVPINVVQELNGEKIVFVAQADGKNTVAKKRVVTLLGVYNGLAHVTGLAAGEKVVTVGYQGLSDGQFIKL
jgi:membrane fusion protein, multidrug efflux system